MSPVHRERSEAKSKDLSALLLIAVAFTAVGCAHGSGVPKSADPNDITFVRFPEGGTVHLNSDHGNVVFLDFWATWCEPCRGALAEVETLADMYKGQPVRFYAVSLDEDPNKITEFLKEQEIKVPVLLDRDAQVAEGVLGLQRIPSAVIVDRRGNVRERHEGYSPGGLIELGRKLNDMIAEK